MLWDLAFVLITATWRRIRIQTAIGRIALRFLPLVAGATLGAERCRDVLAEQDDQKSRIFQYFTSPQFYERMATIAEQFEQMQADLAREKAAMNRTCAKR